MNTILERYKEYLHSLSVSKVTERSYISDVKQFLEAKKIKDIKDLRKLDDDDIDIYIQSLSILKKPLTIKRKRSTLKHFVTFLKLTNLIDKPLAQKTPASVVSIPLSHLLTISYLIVFTIINVLIVSSPKGSSMTTIEEGPIWTIPENISMQQAQVVTMEDAASSNVFTVSADDGVNPFGQASIEKGQSEVTIYNKALTGSSLVFITPVTELKDNTLYVKKINKGYFIIGTTAQPSTDIYFNWLVKTPTVTIN